MRSVNRLFGLSPSEFLVACLLVVIAPMAIGFYSFFLAATFQILIFFYLHHLIVSKKQSQTDEPSGWYGALTIIGLLLISILAGFLSTVALDVIGLLDKESIGAICIGPIYQFTLIIFGLILCAKISSLKTGFINDRKTASFSKLFAFGFVSFLALIFNIKVIGFAESCYVNPIDFGIGYILLYLTIGELYHIIRLRSVHRDV